MAFFFRVFNPISARLQRTLSDISWVIEKVLGSSTCSASFSDKEQVRPQQQEQQVQQDVFLEFLTFVVIIVMEKPPTQEDSTQSEVSQIEAGLGV